MACLLNRSGKSFMSEGFSGFLRHYSSSPPSTSSDIRVISETLRIIALVRSFRERGHYIANLDPLGRTLGPLVDSNDVIGGVEPKHGQDLYKLLRNFPRLDLGSMGLSGIDPNRRYFLGDQVRVVRATQLFWTVSELVSLLRASYCLTSTVEAAHLESAEQQLWVQAAMERPPHRSLLSLSQKRDTLYRLLYADHFERFLAHKFPSSKRFGIEGCESLIPGLYALLSHGSTLGLEAVEIGMAHRGRLNVLHSLLGKPLGSIVREFRSSGEARYSYGGDVKYHLGSRGSLQFGDRRVQISLSPNPSHLEAVNPVVVGKTRARQFFSQDRSRRKSMALLLHGDAAFSGLGIAAEVLQLADLPEYTTGGTVHIIINNQIGFTTDPKLARSSVHPSDMAKAVGAPIFHVNADDPEAVVNICKVAMAWRQTHGKDVVVDIVCYRRHGHNEQDEPSVTQPLAYTKIAKHPTTVQIYSQKLLDQGVVTPTEIDSWIADVEAHFKQQENDAEETVPTPQDWLASSWQGEALGSLSQSRKTQSTGLHLDTLRRVGKAVCELPQGFNAHPLVQKLLDSRRKMVQTGEGINWAMAEALAFGSIMLKADPALEQTQGKNPDYPVRLSGQDVERGTFNQRHAVIFDQKTSRRHVPLNSMAADQSPFLICNSNLSEAAVMGFEYGFSLANENALVMWEAQFGDFANNGQSVIDNFLVSGEDKWMTATNLVLLLPHGYDGQGPEHSSARIERFLQLCGDDPDHVPGNDPQRRAEMEAGFSAADSARKGYVTSQDLREFMASYGELNPDHVSVLMQEFGLEGADRIDWDRWQLFMAQWMRRNSEKDHNLCVVNVTTPANYFHVLRRQVSRPYSKPLVIMSPKFLLHHKACVSQLSDMGTGTFFRRVIADGDNGDNMRHTIGHLLPRDSIRRLILCSGKVYYLLAHARRAKQVSQVALVRLEQIAPLAMDRLARIIKLYPNAELVWVQEEPKNMGAWSYVQPRLHTILRELCGEREGSLTVVRYVGRVASSSTATGNPQIHMEETSTIIESALRVS